jgi:hypothetical protein
MSHRRTVTGRRGARRTKFAGVAGGITLLVLVMVASAFASSLGQVVPSTGGVAGHDYAYWLQRDWEFYFTSPSQCQSATVNGQTVSLAESIGGGNSSCHMPAGHPIFVNSLSTECSTIPGHHNGWGTSKSQLQKCSRTVTEKARITEWLDGQRVPNFGRVFWKTVKQFSVNVPAGRFKGFKGGQVRAAAWGWSLLLKKLSKGKHTVRCRAFYPNGKLEFQDRITLYIS